MTAGELIYPVVVPKWGLTMEEGTLVAWHVAQGAAVAVGDELLEIETSKIANVVEAPYGGILRRHVGQAGQSYPCGALIGVIADASVPEQDVNAFVERHAVATREQVSQRGAAPEVLEVGGRPLRVLRQGTGNELVLLIHGFGGDLNNWLFVQGALAEKRATLAVDLPGHGASGKNLNGINNLDDVAAVLVELLDQLEIRRVHVVAHSLGAAIALALGRHHGKRVASMTLLSPAGLGTSPSPAFIDGFIAARSRREMITILGMLLADEGQVSRDMVNDVLKFKRLDGAEEALREFARFLSLETRPASEALEGISAPIQVIWGASDRVIPFDSARLPDGLRLHVLDGAGHMPHVEKSTQVVQLIEGLLNP
jgi:pyruvate dehydrogenase E2 component (dihydrolipoamide acetyltransferase)